MNESHWMRCSAFFAALVMLLSPTAGRAADSAPAGWFLTGSRPDLYTVGLDGTNAHSGKNCATLKSTAEKAEGFGTLMQNVDAALYRDKRVQLTGFVRSQRVAEGAGLWMRVDGEASKILAFDNMQGRAIRGTTPWTRYSVVLDVSPEAKSVSFGVLLGGSGQVWLDTMTFEPVGRDVSVTGNPQLPEKPRNLDFEQAP